MNIVLKYLKLFMNKFIAYLQAEKKWSHVEEDSGAIYRRDGGVLAD